MVILCLAATVWLLIDIFSRVSMFQHQSKLLLHWLRYFILQPGDSLCQKNMVDCFKLFLFAAWPLNRKTLYYPERITDILARRLADIKAGRQAKPLITVINHRTCMDDPLVWGGLCQPGPLDLYSDI